MPSLKILSIDPSGTGTTGACLITKNSSEEFTFWDFKSKDWQEHLKFVVELVQTYSPAFLVYENTNYIYGRQHQGTTNLFKLLGALVGLEHCFDFLPPVEGVLVNQVKGLKKQVQLGLAEIEGLIYGAGRTHGWKYQGQRLNRHKLDAFLVYILWAKNNLPSTQQLEIEIQTLKAKGGRMGKNQKKRLQKLERIRKFLKGYGVVS